MSMLVRSALGVTGTVMLLHSGYSAFESLKYEKSLDPSSRLETPLDVIPQKLFKLTFLQIRLETVVSVILLCLAVVLNSSELKPVKWREWANSQERETPR